MSGGGGGVDEAEMIALNLFGLEQQMDRRESDVEQGREKGGSEVLHPTGRAVIEDYSKIADRLCEGVQVGNGRGKENRVGWRGNAVQGPTEIDSEGGGREAKSRSRPRRHSEKSPRFPRIKTSLVKQMSEDSSNGFVNLYFDSESELGLTLTSDSQIIPESVSRRSLSESASGDTRGPIERIPHIVEGKDTCRTLRSADVSDGQTVQRLDAVANNTGNNIPRKSDKDGEDSTVAPGVVDSKDIGSVQGQGMVLDINLSVAGSREYSPSPGGGDTQPLLLDETQSESSLRIVGEIVLPFLLAGFGCVFAGIVLDLVKKRTVFVEVSEFFILVPALLGLKGNLEMTLASRLSTQSNLGHMDTTAEQWKMIGGNLALTQAQAIIVGLLAAIFAMILGWIPQRKFHLMQGFLLCTGSVLTAAVASFVLGSVMIGVIMLSRKLHINPDNIATPIAASLGDLVTISLLAEIATLLFTTLESSSWLTPLCLFSIIALIPLWWYISHMNRYTHDVLYTGWTPVIGAMVISSLGGLILDHTVVRFEGVAAFQPVINGVGGNLAAVQASRLSTALHKVSTPGHLPENAARGCPNPITTFCGKSSSARTARLLLLMAVPGQLIFMFTIHFMRQSGETHVTAAFASIYLAAAALQVALLLYIANGLVHFLWKRGNDPDNSSIPYLTAIGDLLGTLLLALAFLILSKTDPGQIMNDSVTLHDNSTQTTVAGIDY